MQMMVRKIWQNTVPSLGLTELFESVEKIVSPQGSFGILLPYPEQKRHLNRS